MEVTRLKRVIKSLRGLVGRLKFGEFEKKNVTVMITKSELGASLTLTDNDLFLSVPLTDEIMEVLKNV